MVDLHEGYLQIDVTRHAEQAIKDARKLGKPVVKIIHGRGKGVLQDVLRRWLSKQLFHKKIAYFRASDRFDEMGAVIYVVVGDGKS